MRITLYNVASGTSSIEQIIQNTATEVGLFGEHLTTRLGKVEKCTSQ
jgi:hypothetical protein